MALILNTTWAKAVKPKADYGNRRSVGFKEAQAIAENSKNKSKNRIRTKAEPGAESRNINRTRIAQEISKSFRFKF